jgi:mono/diheme cytochrome c family protein
MRTVRPIIAAALLGLGVAGGILAWSRVGPATAATETKSSAHGAKKGADPVVERGSKVYAQYCAHCHGAEGKGDGISGQNLTIKPQNLTEGSVLNALPDHFLYKVIAEGAQSVGLSPLMPAFVPQLHDRQVREVIAYIRTLAVPAFDAKAVLPVPEKREGPVQPIFFSHVIHAGSYKIDCQYCHAGARRSSSAGLPSVERCMGCHKIVAQQGNPEVDKLKGYWERKEPIPWVRIFKVPEHAQFPHKNHVQAGLPCQTCHGRIEAMERVTAGPMGTGQNPIIDLMNLAGMPAPPNKLSMGWCVECHRAANTNALASLSWIDKPVPVLRRSQPKAPLECVTCHH